MLVEVVICLHEWFQCLLVIITMGNCIQSQHYVPDGAPIEAIAFRRKSGKNKRTSSKKTRIPQQVQQLPAPLTDEITTLEISRTPSVYQSTPESPLKSPGSIFSGKMKQSNVLRMSVDALEAVDLEIKEKTMLQRKSVFPVWKKHDKCTFCVTRSTLTQEEEEKPDGKELILKVTHMDPMDPRLCRQCSNTMLTTIQNNLRGAQCQGVNMAIAKILAMVSLSCGVLCHCLSVSIILGIFGKKNIILGISG